MGKASGSPGVLELSAPKSTSLPDGKPSAKYKRMGRLMVYPTAEGVSGGSIRSAPSLEESNKAILDIINGAGAMAKPEPRKIDQPLLKAWPAGYERGSFRVVSGGVLLTAKGKPTLFVKENDASHPAANLAENRERGAQNAETRGEPVRSKGETRGGNQGEGAGSAGEGTTDTGQLALLDGRGVLLSGKRLASD